MKRNRLLALILAGLLLLGIGVVAQSVWRQKQAQIIGARFYELQRDILQDNSRENVAKKVAELNQVSDDLNYLRLHRPILKSIGFNLGKAWWDGILRPNRPILPGIVANPHQAPQANLFSSGNWFQSPILNQSVMDITWRVQAPEGSQYAEEAKYCAKTLTREGEVEVCAKEGCYLDADLSEVCCGDNGFEKILPTGELLTYDDVCPYKE